MILGILIGILLMTVVFLLGLILRRKRQLLRISRKGKRAEKMVAGVLDKLKRKDNIVLNDLVIATSGGSCQIDHVLVSTRGIFVIETKSHSGRISGSEHAQYWQQHFESSSQSFYNPLLQNASHIKALRRRIPGLPEEMFISFIVFTGAWRLDIKADPVRECRLWGGERVIARTLVPSEERCRHWWKRGKEVRLDLHRNVMRIGELSAALRRYPQVMDRSRMTRIASLIESLTESGAVLRYSHGRRVKRFVHNGEESIRQGICPRCGGRLSVRKGENGDFIGCARYPECRFVCSVDRLGYASE